MDDKQKLIEEAIMAVQTEDAKILAWPGKVKDAPVMPYEYNLIGRLIAALKNQAGNWQDKAYELRDAYFDGFADCDECQTEEDLEKRTLKYCWENSRTKKILPTPPSTIAKTGE